MDEKQGRLTPISACTVSAAMQGDASSPCPSCLKASLGECLELDHEAAKALSKSMVRQHYDARQVIQNAGDDAHSIGVISSGLAAVVIHTEDGHRQITGFLTEGDLFGFTSDDVYFASVEAITNVAACIFPRALFESIVLSDTDRSRRMVRLVSHELAEAAHHQVVLGRLTAKQRVASLLDDLRYRLDDIDNDNNVVELNMTRADIGDYLGLSMEHVSREFSQLAKDGIIELKTPRMIRIRQQDAIRGLLHHENGSC